jgi:hypothetical protein
MSKRSRTAPPKKAPLIRPTTSRDVLVRQFLEQYVGLDRKPYDRFMRYRGAIEAPVETLFAVLLEIAQIVARSVEFDSISLDRELFWLTFKERMDFALDIYCELCDAEGLGYTHRKTMDFLPAALRAKVDGIKWTPPEADKGWFSDAGSFVPGTSVKL